MCFSLICKNDRHNARIRIPEKAQKRSNTQKRHLNPSFPKVTGVRTQPEYLPVAKGKHRRDEVSCKCGRDCTAIQDHITNTKMRDGWNTFKNSEWYLSWNHTSQSMSELYYVSEERTVSNFRTDEHATQESSDLYWWQSWRALRPWGRMQLCSSKRPTCEFLTDCTQLRQSQSWELKI